MARYSLFVLKVPLNPKQTNKQISLRRLIFLSSRLGVVWARELYWTPPLPVII